MPLVPISNSIQTGLIILFKNEQSRFRNVDFSHLLPGWAYHSTCFAIHTAGPEIHCRAQGRLTLFLSSILAEDA